MSLSKYFPSSEGFQPEQIVRKLSEGEFIRDKQPHQPNRPFQHEHLTPPQPSLDHTDEREETIPPTDDAVQTGEEQESKPQQHDASNDASIPAPSVSEREESEQTVSDQELPPPPAEPEGQPFDPEAFVEKDAAEQMARTAYQKGLEEGLQKAEEDFGSATRSLLAICQQLDTVRETIIANSSKELQDFAFAIAERILRISLLEQDQTILATIDEALHRAVKSDEFTVYVHPDDHAVVKAKSEDLVAGIAGLNSIVVKEDITVERGGCRIESDNCTIDATVAAQFDAIREEMRTRLG